ncbi:MAG TPA: CRISPR-associated endonuclease Cas2 [Syntrophorhabdaceae bacterium]|jgi:CRISPR-associated protein Cas2|nr:CRISPR-associated endonuclease Cas2 [Syntrophorhabdaceae bacterium]HOS59530.1 CRISPR-associated endonuclease Cas2 [Syntrophorhabdaceae bacterium]HQG51838.1 CRISPR-associated endonuclease Cas2 [Syntrophorhabdaceae bacterium]
MSAGYLVCYDIRDEKRLIRVFKAMKKRGLHIQYSVFYCRLEWYELLELKAKLKDIIDESMDDLRIYPLPDDGKVSVMGKGERIPDGVMVYL